MEIADPFEGPANVLFGVVDDDDEEEGVINKVITWESKRHDEQWIQ